jgi:hypothetical protein
MPSTVRGELISAPTASATARIFDAKNMSSTTEITKLIVASYNIRYARGRYLIWGRVAPQNGVDEFDAAARTRRAHDLHRRASIL